jgi:hypothetical protein
MTTNAMAYLDPGSAGILLQMVIGGVAALLLTIKLFWRRIFRALHIGRAREAEPASRSTER